MSRSRLGLIAIIVLAAALVGAAFRADGPTQTPASAPGANVDGERIANADREPGNWMIHGRTYSEQRFSPLQQITDKNVGQLSLAWSIDLDTNRGQESTPVVVDGVMYFTTAWSKVFAVNAATGEALGTTIPRCAPSGR